ncbi:MAG: hypothetical protein Q7S01_01485 [bacterium]|nr:hypothetical protein [bacterium]
MSPHRVDEAGKIYTPLQIALSEIEERRRNPVLAEKIKKFFGDFPPPKEFGDMPRVVLVRYIMSPTFEYSYFLDMCKGLRFKPLFLEFASDKFVAKNPSKYSLCNMSFFTQNISGEKKVKSRMKLVNFNKDEGKLLCDIVAKNGEKLVDLHHRILKESGGHVPGSLVDFSEWFRKSTTLSKEYYYLYYLALFLVNGILFENFLLNKTESAFTKGKVIPAFDKLVEMFGVRPLIVHLAPRETDEDPFWEYYDKRIKPMVEKSK